MARDMSRDTLGNWIYIKTVNWICFIGVIYSPWRVVLHGDEGEGGGLGLGDDEGSSGEGEGGEGRREGKGGRVLLHLLPPLPNSRSLGHRPIKGQGGGGEGRRREKEEEEKGGGRSKRVK